MGTWHRAAGRSPIRLSGRLSFIAGRLPGTLAAEKTAPPLAWVSAEAIECGTKCGWEPELGEDCSLHEEICD